MKGEGSVFTEQLMLQIKAMKGLFFVPLIGYYVILPLGVWALSADPECILVDAIAQVSYRMVPFLCVWWQYLVVREYVEGDGSEVLLLGKSPLASGILSRIFVPIQLTALQDGELNMEYGGVFLKFLGAGVVFWILGILASHKRV